jgi:hypothetical protein
MKQHPYFPDQYIMTSAEALEEQTRLGASQGILDMLAAMAAAESAPSGGPTPTTNDRRHICVLCGEWFTGYGHNPEPLADYATGRACDVCNDTKIILARLGHG